MKKRRGEGGGGKVEVLMLNGTVLYHYNQWILIIN